MGRRNRPTRSDEERRSPRPFIVHRSAEQEASKCRAVSSACLIPDPPSSAGTDVEASRRSQEAVTFTCAVPPASASTLSSAPVRAVISIPNSTVRESGRCSSMAWRTDATTPRTVSAKPGRHNASAAGLIRRPSPTSTAPAAPSLVAAGAAPCTRTHIRSPLGSITWTISDVVPPSHFGDPALRNVLRVHLSVKTTFRATNIRCLRPYRLCGPARGDAAGDPADTRNANYASRRHIASGIGAVLEYLLQLLPVGEPGAHCKTINGLIGTGAIAH